MADSLTRSWYCSHCCTTFDARYDEARLATILTCSRGCIPPRVVSMRDWVDLSDAEQEQLRVLIDRTAERDEVQQRQQQGCTCGKGQPEFHHATP